MVSVMVYGCLVLRFSVIVERDVDGWFVGSVPELPGCHTQGRTLDELLERIREAVDLYIDVEGFDVDSLREFVGVQFLEVSLHES
jgi:predicted RNase H-like HicB family nuclease